MSDLRSLALSRIPSAVRQDADRVADLLEAGYKPREVAAQLGMPRQRVGELRGRLRDGMVEALAADGYSPGESARYLGVPTSMIAAARPDG